jgi:hypothetical protein
MAIKHLAALPSDADAVAAINQKLGTDFTAADYARWDRGGNSRRSQEFDEAVQKYVGATKFNAVGTLASLWALVKYIVLGK